MFDKGSSPIICFVQPEWLESSLVVFLEEGSTTPSIKKKNVIVYCYSSCCLYCHRLGRTGVPCPPLCVLSGL